MPRLIIDIVGDTRKLERAFQKAERDTRTFSQKMGRIARVGVFAGAATAVTGLGIALRSGAREFSEMEQASAQTDAVLKSTGGAAGVTAARVDELARSISAYSGADDEAVQAGENLLLTFTQIRDSAGRGNDIFDQTTRVMADMAQALGIDMTNAAMQLGKALNDPVRGVSRLQRVGVAFTESQKRQIKAFMDQGRVMDAQRVILAELNREFGGSARMFGTTLPGKIQRFEETLRNVAGEITENAAPSFERLVDQGLKWIQNAENQERVTDAVTGSIEALGKAAEITADSIGFLAAAWDKLPDFGKDQGLLDLLDKLPGGVDMSLTDLLGARTDLWSRGAGKAGLKRGYDAIEAARSGALAAATGGAEPPATTPAKPPRGATAAQRNAWFDAMIGRQLVRVQDIGTMRGQISRLDVIADMIRDRLGITKDVTRRLHLEDELLDVMRRQRATKATLADEISQRAADAKAAAAAAREAAVEEKLGWLEFGVERAETTKAVKDDRAWLRKVEAYWKERIAHEGRKLEFAQELWRTQQKIRDLNKKQTGGNVTGFRHMSPHKLAGMLGLTGAAAGRGAALLSTVGMGGSMPGRASGAFVINGPMHFHGVQNVRELEETMAKVARGRAHTRRGAR